MTTHVTATREAWLKARRDLLAAEKDLTRRSDELARRRQELPWVRVDKAYRFDTDAGSAALADLFRGRSQLLVYHFMFGPDWTAGCPSCSMIADGFNGFAVHLANHDVMLWAVSRAPLAKLQAYKRRMGWTFPWASLLAGDNFDFNVSFTEEQQRDGLIEYNYERGGHAMDATPVPQPVAQFAAACGTDARSYSRDRPGMSAFVLERGVVYHTYSTYARGWMASGACTRGSIVRRRGAIRRASGGAATTSMTMPDVFMTSRSGGSKQAFEDSRGSAARVAADWLCLAATPTFAIMALLTAFGRGQPDSRDRSSSSSSCLIASGPK